MESILSNIDAKEPMLIAIYYVQIVMVFVFGIMFLFGIFMFIYSFKSPFRRRLAYITTILGPIGVLFVIHGPVLILNYVFDSPIAPDPELGLYIFEPNILSARISIYDALVRIVQPLLVAVFLIGIGVLHHASRIPNRKRIGYGVFLGVPLLWTLMQLGPSIINLLTS
ncbi:MAG: hypothetical protein KBT36_09150 [Kurthia sp.]|nr:hypothetical protein [Candidatus Kurthia equi]